MGKTIVAISGGIGSGKSVVSRVLHAIGYSVYDCDSQAKSLMDADDEIKRRIAREIHAEAITPDFKIDRKLLSQIVFSDKHKLEILNSIVHASVRSDICAWANSKKEGLLFVETAILYQSGLDSMVDAVWEVTAPDSIRVERVMRRNGLRRSDVLRRIESQRYVPDVVHPRVSEIVNDNRRSVLLQIQALLAQVSERQ